MRHPKRKNRVRAVRLWFKGVGVKRGRVVANIQFAEPREIPQHESRTEANRVPFLQIIINAFGLFVKILPRAIQLAVVAEIMNAHFKASLRQVAAKFRGASVFPLRNEIK